MDDRDIFYKEKMKRNGLNIKEDNFRWRLCTVETKESKQMVNCLRTSFLHGFLLSLEDE